MRCIPLTALAALVFTPRLGLDTAPQPRVELSDAGEVAVFGLSVGYGIESTITR